jgi:hypothetical protein
MDKVQKHNSFNESIYVHMKYHSNQSLLLQLNLHSFQNFLLFLIQNTL